MEHVINYFGAVRPNPYFLVRGEGGEFAIDDSGVGDLCIVESGDGSFISFVGIKTPGLTCANELGRETSDKIAAQLGAAPNLSFDPCRSPPVRLSELTLEERGALIRGRADYGHIVCRCRGVSEGEVVDAIRSLPGAVTLDGVRRRTGAGAGRCQGGYCSRFIMGILARELRCDIGEVTKCGGESRVLVRSADRKNIES